MRPNRPPATALQRNPTNPPPALRHRRSSRCAPTRNETYDEEEEEPTPKAEEEHGDLEAQRRSSKMLGGASQIVSMNRVKCNGK